MVIEVSQFWQIIILYSILLLLVLSSFIGVVLLLKEMNIGGIYRVLLGARSKVRKTYEGKVNVLYENSKGLMLCTKA